MGRYGALLVVLHLCFKMDFMLTFKGIVFFQFIIVFDP